MSLPLPLTACLAATPRIAPAGILEILIPPSTAPVDTGALDLPLTARFAPAPDFAGEERLGLERTFGLDFGRDLALLFVRAEDFDFLFGEEARFFIFLGLLDLGLLLERFPAMNDPSLGDESDRFSEAA
jgi:hypothetical protein